MTAVRTDGAHLVLHSDHENAALPSIGDLAEALPEYAPRALLLSGLRATVGLHNTNPSHIQVLTSVLSAISYFYSIVTQFHMQSMWLCRF